MASKGPKQTTKDTDTRLLTLLKGAKSKVKRDRQKSFQRHLDQLEHNLDKNAIGRDVTCIEVLLNELREIEEPRRRDVDVNDAIKSLSSYKEKFEQTSPKTSTNGTTLTAGVKGQGLTPDSSWVASSIKRVKDWLEGGADLTSEDFKKGCPRNESFESLRKELVFIKDDIKRRIELPRQKEEELANRLKDLYESLKVIAKNTEKAKVSKKDSTDPDEKVVSNIEQLFVDMCRNSKEYELKVQEIVDSIENGNIPKEEHIKTLDRGFQIIWKAIRANKETVESRPADFYETEIELLKKEVQDGIYDIEKASSRMQKESVKIKTDLIFIRKTLREREQTTQCISEEIKCLEREIKDGKYDNDKVVTGIEDMSEDLANIYTIRILLNERDSKEVKETNSKGETEKLEFALETKNKKAEITKGSYNENKLREETKRLTHVINKMKDELNVLRKEKDDLLLRFSKEASAQLTQNNPNIADLSDPNRPTKLAEKYREMYDNEWTEAYEALEKQGKRTEKDICSVLVKVLFEAESYCTHTTSVQKNAILAMLLRPTKLKTLFSKELTSIKGQDLKIDSVQSKMIHELTKEMAKTNVTDVIEGFECNSYNGNNIQMRKYTNKCVEICWYMSLQAPPLLLEKLDKTETTFNKSKYTEYTHSGSKIDFVTWPPLLLHKGGALLGKGVAQGKGN